ncbi:MAG: hypothetical protein IJ584_14685, partial [Bacteroidales bacterium]|nr:hypothetical protein [Bacteroidales bacterium]
GEVYIAVHLNKKPFWKRLKYAIKYIFGYQCKYGAFDEIILNPDDAERLQKVVDYLRKSPSEGAQSNFADIRKNEEKLNKVVAAINDMPLENELTDEQLDTYWRTCYNASLDCDMEKHKRGL